MLMFPVFLLKYIKWNMPDYNQNISMYLKTYFFNKILLFVYLAEM
jgi:hypothetical protein